MPDELFCGSCGTNVPDDSRFCPGCGERQLDADPAAVVAAPPPIVAAPAEEQPTARPASSWVGVDGPRLLGALTDAIGVVRATDPRNVEHSDALTALHEAADRAFDAGLDDEAGDVIMNARDGTPERIGDALVRTWLRINDAEFRRHSVVGLGIRRVTLSDGFATAPTGLGFSLSRTNDDSLMTVLDDPREREILSVAAEIQLFVNNDLPEDQATALHQRGFDETGLHTPLIQAYYGTRTVRRAVWGAGMYTLTDRRIVGVLWDNESKSSTVEKDAMPMLMVATDGASVVAFSCDRAAFEDIEIVAPLLQPALPAVTINGDCCLATLTGKVLDRRSGRLVKPGRRVVADAVAAFMG